MKILYILLISALIVVSGALIYRAYTKEVIRKRGNNDPDNPNIIIGSVNVQPAASS
jgi:hypothetical protein